MIAISEMNCLISVATCTFANEMLAKLYDEIKLN